MTAPIADTWPFTVTQFIMMAIFALLAIAGILYGMQLKRRRAAAQDALEQHRDAAGDNVPQAERPDATRRFANPRPRRPRRPRPLRRRRRLPIGRLPRRPRPWPRHPPAPAAAAPPAGDIMQLKGLGPKLAATLAGLGITRIDQITAMDAGELDALDAQLGAFRGRPARDRWGGTGAAADGRATGRRTRRNSAGWAGRTYAGRCSPGEHDTRSPSGRFRAAQAIRSGTAAASSTIATSGATASHGKMNQSFVTRRSIVRAR